jgi:hypothetical protein
MDQLVGRVVRIHEGKPNPIVIVPKFTGKTVEKQSMLMKSYFMKCGYNVIDL